MMAFRKIILSQRGQGLIELGLTLPLLLLFALGAVEISNLIHSYLVLTHLTREGANLISRGATAAVGGLDCSSPDDALDSIITAASPVIQCDSPSRWRVIYSKVGADPDDPNAYVVLEQAIRGSLDVTAMNTKRICPDCGVADFTCPGTMSPPCPSPSNLPSIGAIAPGRTFHAVEVFYQYMPITPVANFGVNIGGPSFYERAVF